MGQNEFGDVFDSRFWAWTLVGQCLELRANNAGLVSNHSVFHFHEMHIIYVYQIEDREVLVKNSGLVPHESLSFGRKATDW